MKMRNLLLAAILSMSFAGAALAAPPSLLLSYRYHLTNPLGVDVLVEHSIYRDGLFLERTTDLMSNRVTLRRCQASPERLHSLTQSMDTLTIGLLDPGSCLSLAPLFGNGAASDIAVDWFGRKGRQNNLRFNESEGGGAGPCPAEVASLVTAISLFVAETDCSVTEIFVTVP